MLVAARPPAAAPAAEPPAFLALDDVRPGMAATVRTVLRGTDIAELPVEIVSVIRNAGPEQDLILARGLGEPLGTLGISQGMSGSPAYVDGKLLGAVSSTWAFSKEPIFGITPAEQMEREASWSFEHGKRASAPSGSSSDLEARSPFASSALEVFRAAAPPALAANRSVPIGSPLVLAGFDRRIVELASDLFAPWGLRVTEGGTGGSSSEGGAIEPGATLGVRLAGGDADMTAIGTVTWVDEDRVHGWGHPFFQSGDVELPLVTGYIHAVVPSHAISFKVGSGGDVVGTITNDRRSGIAGRLGRMPRLTAMQLDVVQRGVPKTFHYEVVRDRTLAPVLVGLLSANSLLVREGGIGDQTVRFRQRVVLAGGRETTVETVFAGDQTIPQIVDLLSQATQVVATNPFEDVAIERIEAELVCEEGIRAAQLLSVALDDASLSPGEEVRGSYVLKAWRGEESRRPIRIPLPKDARAGRYLLLVADASTAEQFESEREPRAFRPRTLDELLNRIRRLKRTDEVHVHVYRQSQGVLLDGRPLADLPASARSVLAGAARSGSAEDLPAELVAEVRLPANQFVQGAHTILFEVRKEKP